ncbi:MAG: tRNA uridine-5-carboxymethylaminomethyl(34) synthesis GTPase MnmE [Clostridia bacterium]|nr:tRNA uridine-5-carboxymethylaminomethyl(34) synthesis GTPase MnmE [Oscillospiraceae bacterium]MBQ7960402.1 tRNA uridine-5-carboxymethylaminomethyl(34) synthesis GTPase MnmE [Clostridia bacterium]
MKEFDTIGAIATPIGVGGIAIIRISGTEAEAIASAVAFPKNGKSLENLESHKLTLSEIRRASDGSVLDEALVAVMRGPNSYTGENVVEINCHGGFFAAESVLEELFRCGMRQAEAGEFTRRAFVNGKMDLIGAEAVVDLIHSNSSLGQSNAAKALSGKLSAQVDEIRNKAVAFAANISAVADFPDEIEPLSDEELEEKISEISNDIEVMLSGFSKGKLMRDGIMTVIAGRPNVGKSSLLNALSRTERAIVTDIPGTTRDTIEEYVNLSGVALRLVDTAGIRESDNSVEKIGIDRAKKNIEDADLCLFVLDSSKELSDEDMEIFGYMQNKNIIVILNKTDKGAILSTEELGKKLHIDEQSIVLTATPENGEISGIDNLEEKIMRMFLSGGISSDDVFISNDRQKNALIKAKAVADGMLGSLRSGMPADMLYVDLEEVIAALGEVTGQTVQDEIIDRVFERFCVGK